MVIVDRFTRCFNVKIWVIVFFVWFAEGVVVILRSLSYQSREAVRATLTSVRTRRRGAWRRLSVWRRDTQTRSECTEIGNSTHGNLNLALGLDDSQIPELTSALAGLCHEYPLLTLIVNVSCLNSQQAGVLMWQIQTSPIHSHHMFLATPIAMVHNPHSLLILACPKQNESDCQDVHVCSESGS